MYYIDLSKKAAWKAFDYPKDSGKPDIENYCEKKVEHIEDNSCIYKELSSKFEVIDQKARQERWTSIFRESRILTDLPNHRPHPSDSFKGLSIVGNLFLWLGFIVRKVSPLG